MTHTTAQPNPAWTNVLMDARRFDQWAPSTFLQRLALQPGQIVIDLGCGPGFWTRALAEIVTERGTVLAVDGCRMFLSELVRRLPPSHVKPIECTMPAIPLPDSIADCVWIAFTLHEVDDPLALAREVRRIVKAGGRFIVLDWHPDTTAGDAPPPEERLAPDQVASWLRSAGFSGAAVTWVDSDAYLVS